MIYLVIIFTILFFVLAWRRLDWAVMILIAALPAYLIRFKIFGLPLTLLEAMIWSVFLTWLLKNYKNIFENIKLKIKHSLSARSGSALGGKIPYRYPFDWEIVMLLIVALSAVAIGGFSNSAFGIWKAYFFEPALLFIVVINVVIYNANTTNGTRILQINSGVEKILWPMAVSALAVSLLAIYQKLTGALIDNPLWAAAETRRVISFFGYPNAVGLYLGPIVWVMVGWFFSLSFPKPKAVGNPGVSSTDMFLDSRLRGNDRGMGVAWNDKIKTIFISLTIILSTLAIYFAKSKGALLGVAAGLAVFGLLSGKKIRRLTAAVIIAVAVGVAVYQPARELAVSNITFTNKSGQIRQAGWSDTWKMLKDGRLITGAGLANYQSAVKPDHTEGIFVKDYTDPEAQRKLVYNEAYRTAHWQPLEIYLYPHNIILNFWSELGLAGMLLFVWIIGKYFWIGLKLEINNKFQISNFKFLNIGLICAMIVIIVHGIVDVPYFKNDLAVMFWLFIAMMGINNLKFLINK